MSEPVNVCCPACAGTGRIALTGVYAETLTLLRRQRRPTSGAALARLAKCQGTAMANRLVALERHGLAVAERYGRARLWVAVEGR